MQIRDVDPKRARIHPSIGDPFSMVESKHNTGSPGHISTGKIRFSLELDLITEEEREKE